MACLLYTSGEVKEVSYDKLTVNMTRYELKVDGKVVDAPPKELELLFHLASHPNRVFTRDQLLDEVWGFEYYGDSRTVDVHIKRLREKLEGVSDQWSLKTCLLYTSPFLVNWPRRGLCSASFYTMAAALVNERAGRTGDFAKKFGFCLQIGEK